MRKNPAAYGILTGAVLIVATAFGQESPSVSPSPGMGATELDAVTPTPPAVGIGTPGVTPNLFTPTPSPVFPTPSALLPTPPVLPTPSAIPPTPGPLISPGGGAAEPSAVVSSSSFQWSEKGAPAFTLDKAVLTALKQNPDVLRALQELERSKGVIVEIRAQALPHITPAGLFQWTDPELGSSGGGVVGGSGGGTTGASIGHSDIFYNIRLVGTQLIFNGTTYPSIRGTFFQRDSAYFAFRTTLDQVIATVKTQFYQVILDRALIGVQEDSVRLLESQLKDQQNRFDAGTVPRFNVLQAQVQLSNQIPSLITARNNYRISILQLAKTLGLEFNPARGVAAPLRVVGELVYTPRSLSLLRAIEEGKRNRPLLKEARANVLNQIEQVHVALGGFLPTINTTGGGEWVSSPFKSSFGDVSKGWLAEVMGSWPIWDSGEVYGRYKQQRALLSEAKITYEDDVRQVELEIQQAASNVLQNRELIKATEKTVEQADEALRLAKARLDAGAGTQLDVLNAQVQLTTAQSTRLQALFGYDSSLAEFDRVTGAQSSYTEVFSDLTPRAARRRTYYTGSDVDAQGKPKRNRVLGSTTVTPMSETPTSK
jgi:outer membrane protein